MLVLTEATGDQIALGDIQVKMTRLFSALSIGGVIASSSVGQTRVTPTVYMWQANPSPTELFNPMFPSIVKIDLGSVQSIPNVQGPPTVYQVLGNPETAGGVALKLWAVDVPPKSLLGATLVPV